jgi:hypothetical protein
MEFKVDCPGLSFFCFIIILLIGDFECKTGFWKHLPSHRLKKGRLHSQACRILGMQFPGGGSAPGGDCIPDGKLKKSSKGSTNLFAKKPQPGFRQKIQAAALHYFGYFSFEKKPRRVTNPAGLASAALLIKDFQ